ncbi:transposase [Neisseria meningitidis]|nr:transposase [Neisseria meningitidis]
MECAGLCLMHNLFCRDMPFGIVINKNQDKATKPQTVQIVRQGEATPYWFLLIHYILVSERSDTKVRNVMISCRRHLYVSHNHTVCEYFALVSLWRRW